MQLTTSDIISLTKMVRYGIKSKYGLDVEPRWEFMPREMAYRIVFLRGQLAVEYVVSEYSMLEPQELFDELTSKCLTGFNLKETTPDELPLMERAELVASLCTYKQDWNVPACSSNTGVYFQLVVKNQTCSQTGSTTEWKSGKRYLSEWMTTQEMVGVIFALIKDAEMHELHEWFRYKGASIYNPHLSPDALAELASKKESFETRPDSMKRA